jgi:hypothetical protein
MERRVLTNSESSFQSTIFVSPLLYSRILNPDIFIRTISKKGR